MINEIYLLQGKDKTNYDIMRAILVHASTYHANSPLEISELPTLNFSILLFPFPAFCRNRPD